MDQKKNKSSSPRIKVIQKIYGSLMNPDEVIIYSKNQYKKYIKDVVSGTLERIELIEETIVNNIERDINLKKIDNIKKIYVQDLIKNNKINKNGKLPMIKNFIVFFICC